MQQPFGQTTHGKHAPSSPTTSGMPVPFGFTTIGGMPMPFNQQTSGMQYPYYSTAGSLPRPSNPTTSSRQPLSLDPLLSSKQLDFGDTTVDMKPGRTMNSDPSEPGSVSFNGKPSAETGQATGVQPSGSQSARAASSDPSTPSTPVRRPTYQVLFGR